MLPPGFYRYSATARNLTLVADAGDFFTLNGGADPYLILGVRVYQTGSATLAQADIRLHRGTTDAATGGAITEREYTTDGPASTVTALSLPTTDVSTDDWEEYVGFNNLQEIHVLPIPELWIPMKIGDNLGIANASSTAHTGVGVTVQWAEFHG
jgi:hypothetical protein